MCDRVGYSKRRATDSCSYLQAGAAHCRRRQLIHNNAILPGQPERRQGARVRER